MAESTSTRGRRQRRSTRVSQQLERARQRNAEQLAEQRAREERVEQALAEFVGAGDAIATEEHACEEKVAAYQRKIDELRAETQTKVADQHTRQARAALEIHEAGRTVDQVAELLELKSEKEARRLIATGRATDEQNATGTAGQRADTTASPPHDGGGAEESEVTPGAMDSGSDDHSSGEQAQPDRFHGQQHRTDTGVVSTSFESSGDQSA